MSFQPSQPQRKSRSSLIVAVASTVVVAIVAVVLLSRGGDDDTATTATTVEATASSAASGTVTEGTATTDSAGPAAGIAPSSLPPITNGGPTIVTGTVAVGGNPLPQFPASGADKAVGVPFPELTGVKVTDSSPLAITNDGRPKVLIYIAHWCPHCQKEVPLLTAYFAGKGMPQGVDLYAVSTGVAKDRGNFPPADWLIKEQFPVPTLADDAKNTAFTAAGLTSFPSFVAVGADGTVKLRASGELTVDQFEQVLAAAQD